MTFNQIICYRWCTFAPTQRKQNIATFDATGKDVESVCQSFHQAMDDLEANERKWSSVYVASSCWFRRYYYKSCIEIIIFLPWHDKYYTVLLSEVCILDEEAKAEVLAIRFSNPENASKFKAAFDNAVINVTELEAKNIELSETDASEDATKKEINESPAPKKESEKEITEELKHLTVEEK